jgi:hypothetical protein
MAQINWKRWLLAVAIAPLGVPALMVAYISVVGRLAGDVLTLSETLQWSLITLPFSYAGAVIVGLPAALLLHRIGRFQLGWLLVAGFIIGGLFLYFIFGPADNFMGKPMDEYLLELLVKFLFNGFLGVVVAMVFGLVAGAPLRRPLAVTS